MNRMHLKIETSIIACVIMILLCSCNLFVTDKDRFYLDKDLNYTLSRIDIKKTGPDIIIPAKVGNRTVWRIYLADPYFSRIDSLDISNVKELESFTIKLFGMNTGTKLKKLDFSKNKKLKYIDISKTTSLKKVIFNNNCEDIYLEGTSVKKVNIKLLKNLRDFSYYNGPLEELDVSNNPYLEQIWIENANIKVLDVSKNPKLKHIIVDEGTQIIGPTNAQIEYNKKTE
ncbi:hypothetical protein [Mogibacterium diversum]